MTVEKFIRILGYMVYTMLWSPVIILGLIIMPVVFMIMFRSVTDGLLVYKQGLKSSILHDMKFIETGVWY